MRKPRREGQTKKSEKGVSREPVSSHGLLLVRVLLIQIPDGFQSLIKALDFRLVLRPQDPIPGHGGLRLFSLVTRGQNLSPVLAVGDAVDESVPGETPEVAKQAVAGIEVAGINQQ